MVKLIQRTADSLSLAGKAILLCTLLVFTAGSPVFAQDAPAAEAPVAEAEKGSEAKAQQGELPPPEPLLKETLDIFLNGGAIMYMLASVAFILYATAFAALTYVNRGNLNAKDSDKWDDWLEHPDKAEGRMGEAIRYVLHGERVTLKTVQRRFQEVKINVVSAVDRRLLVVNTLTAAAPLAGLLGTVMGMLAMFSGLAQGQGAGGMAAVAGGMQEALITTQTGLTIALPGLFIGLVIKNKRNAISAAIARLESMVVTKRFKQST